ncbi:DUF4097 family beta strand repeat-containing protein [Dinghuibacter silviterrae]|uniref:Adhesin n=1 Tax=Dinghuibacter silviterrae TaxID=1539049 RepID=A0A4V3GKP0_9BACT|nr:hypothetical protein [Dinghuibacter silviterrae]TDW96412.1 hypothetical protein EDB95_4242 [Dinghuibacter silviterrae]
MKTLITLLLLTAGSAAARAQTPRLVDEHVPLGAGGHVKLDIQIVDSIQVVTWDKNEVWVKGSIDVNDNKENDKYVVTFDKSPDKVEVKTRLEKIEENKGCNCNCNNVQAAFTVYVPAGTDVSIETINGNITITGQTGAVRAHSISGFVDMAVNPAQKADLKFRTISGNMYSNLNLEVQDKHYLHQVGGNVVTTLNGGGGKSIDLETISGDIFLRKAKEGL